MSIVEDGTAFVQHYFDQLYDPVKAHQYYEDHKKLTPRTSKGNDSSGRGSSGSKVKAAVQETAAQKKAKLDAEVAALQARLEQLRILLRELVAEAKKRSGIKTTPEGETATGDKKTADEKLTPAQKSEKAKEQHDYYEKTKGTLPSQESTRVLKQKIALIEKKIAEMRAQLASLPELANKFTAQVERRPSPSGPEKFTTAVRKGDSQNGS